jgi:hypothetical protein
MTKRKLRKNADISPPQSPHDGIHTCSKGCNKPGCTRTLRETIEEQEAQVERLDTLCKQLMAQHSDISCENIMLRKAGDAMASSIQFNEEMAKDYNGPTIVHQSVQRWNAAKEGKQP